jgi:hypothetical protein
LILCGLLFSIPQTSNSIPVHSTVTFLIDSVANADFNEQCLVYLRILILLKNGNTHYRNSLGNDKNLSHYISLIFHPKISPEVRLRLAIYVSLIIESSPEFFSASQQGWHMISHLLLEERCELTRAFAIRILGNLMDVRAPVFNSYIMRIIFHL